MSQTRKYETICVFQPDLQGEQLKAVEDKITKILNANKAEEITKKDWGNRKLAYQIKKFKTGHYVEYIYTAPVTVINDLEKNLGYEETVLRYLTIKQTKRTPENVQVEPSGFTFAE